MPQSLQKVNYRSLHSCNMSKSKFCLSIFPFYLQLFYHVQSVSDRSFHNAGIESKRFLHLPLTMDHCAPYRHCTFLCPYCHTMSAKSLLLLHAWHRHRSVLFRFPDQWKTFSQIGRQKCHNWIHLLGIDNQSVYW